MDNFILNNNYLEEAWTLLNKGDYVQASEKVWGAAASIVKAVAIRQNIEVKSHGELYKFVAKVKDELNDPEWS